MVPRAVEDNLQSEIYLCSPKKVEGVSYLPMIRFKRVLEQIDLSRYDTLLFTSKQAVVFTNEICSNWRDKKILAVGEQTAKVCREFGAKDIYFPTEYYGSVLASDIVRSFANAKIVYLRPRVISFDSTTFMQSQGIDIEERILYETQCIEYEKDNLTKNATIIFTSPSTIQCFFKSFQWRESYKAVVIGKTTLKQLPKGICATVSPKATIAACIETAQNL